MSNTSEAGLFIIVEESSKSAGVRRITALTRGSAKKTVEAEEAFEKQLEAAFDLKGQELVDEEMILKTRVKVCCAFSCASGVGSPEFVWFIGRIVLL